MSRVDAGCRCPHRRPPPPASHMPSSASSAPPPLAALASSSLAGLSSDGHDAGSSASWGSVRPCRATTMQIKANACSSSRPCPSKRPLLFAGGATMLVLGCTGSFCAFCPMVARPDLALAAAGSFALLAAVTREVCWHVVLTEKEESRSRGSNERRDKDWEDPRI